MLALTLVSFTTLIAAQTLCEHKCFGEQGACHSQCYSEKECLKCTTKFVQCQNNCPNNKRAFKVRKQLNRLVINTGTAYDWADDVLDTTGPRPGTKANKQ